MKAVLATTFAAAMLVLVGCNENPASPGQPTDQTISSIRQTPVNSTSSSDSRSRGRGRRDSLKVEGTVTAVDTVAGTVTIGTHLVQTDSSTKIERNEMHVRLSAIQVGDRAEARLARSGIALTLEVEGENGGHHGGEVRYEGMVTAVDTSAGTLTIGTNLVQTDAQTRIERNHSTAPLSAIQVGDRAEARIPEGSTAASRVEAESH